MVRWVARTYVSLALLGVVASVLTGLVLERQLWAPAATTGIETYDHALRAHGALFALLLTPALVAGLGYLTADDTPLRLPALAWVPVAAWLVAFAIAGSLAVSPPSSWNPYSPLGAEPDHRLAIVRYAAAASGVLAGAHLAITARHRTLLAMFAGLAALASVLSVLDHTSGVLPVTASVLGVVALVYGARTHRPTVAIYAAGSILTAAAYLALTAFLDVPAIDVHLADTYVITGGEHLRAAAVVLALLAAVHAWSEPLAGRTPQSLLATVAALAITGAFVDLVVAMILAGSDGMPRHYYTYSDLPSLVHAHRLATVGGYVLAAGLAVGALAWLFGRTAGPRPRV